jgi:aminopeptidase S
MRLIRPSVLLCALLLAACASTQRNSAPAARGVAAKWHAHIVAISAGRTSAKRGEAITTELASLGLRANEQPFTAGGKSGRNLIADVGGPAGGSLLLIGAHYDQVAVGHGATDNASGVATVLQLAAAFKARPLARHRVQVAFWDLEEAGLLGSQAYVKTPNQQRPALYVNFDVFAWGDTLWMMSPTPSGPLANEASDAARATGLAYRAGTEYPNTDHRAFLAAGWPAVSFSLMGKDEIDDTLKFFTGGKPAKMPKAATVLHSAGDTLDKVDATNIPLALRTLEEAIRAWDAR